MYAKTTAIRCPSHNPVETCAILGLSSSRDELVVIDGCGYCDTRGQCHYRGRIGKVPEHRKEHKEPGEVEDRKERRKPGRVQVSLHIFLGGGGA